MEKTVSESYKQDKVSVIIPTYNRFQYLLNTIQSVKGQTYSNIEIIVEMIGQPKRNITITIGKKII